jgi:hypothetical protein
MAETFTVVPQKPLFPTVNFLLHLYCWSFWILVAIVGCSKNPTMASIILGSLVVCHILVFIVPPKLIAFANRRYGWREITVDDAFLHLKSPVLELKIPKDAVISFSEAKDAIVGSIRLDALKEQPKAVAYMQSVKRDFGYELHFSANAFGGRRGILPFAEMLKRHFAFNATGTLAETREYWYPVERPSKVLIIGMSILYATLLSFVVVHFL